MTTPTAPENTGGCTRCGGPVAPPENWPGENGGEVCQDCWEAECSESWWAMVDALGRTEAGRVLLGEESS